MILTERAFSTFEAAKACGVFHTTVINWVNKGMLRARTTPGGHRRIAMPDLVNFMKQFDMPIPENLTRKEKKLLIVEDDPAVQRMLKRTLESIPGIEIQTCAGGLEALIAIGKDAPDLLILDIRIPQVNGIEVCQVLKSSEQTKPIKIVAITGEPLPSEAAIFLKGAVDAFFQKPLPTTELKAKALSLLDIEEESAVKR